MEGFTEEIKIRVTAKQKEELFRIADSKGRNVSEYIRGVLRDYNDMGYMQSLESTVQKYVAAAVEEKLRPVENRMAKINAKTAYATAISIYILAQVLADLGVRDIAAIFNKARQRAISFVRTSSFTTAELERLLDDVYGKDEDLL